jgi:hypothetical protein
MTYDLLNILNPQETSRHAHEETIMTDHRSNLYRLADHSDAKTLIIMGDDPRLVVMPKAPTLMDFFRLRFGIAPQHLLQSARLAVQAGHSETVITACLLHDIAVCGFIRGDHGYWGEQLIAPYVTEEVAWAVRTHQALRFYADESVGYSYPSAYVEWFGEDFKPDAYIEHEYQEALKHPWYMTSRLVTLNDYYAFDPNVVVPLEEFEDIIGRNFKQPVEGLGFDGSPCAHLWRTIIRPNKFL